ncbi:hypothetical protein BHE74_00026262 [Ensete ventricosum]|nr:hypothetical protein GW17_00001437 [Ensete ventricosum]RWW66371.1 hypothetical protein BHE74_00026262 [Ensete ventricosum]
MVKDQEQGGGGGRRPDLAVVGEVGLQNMLDVGRIGRVDLAVRGCDQPKGLVPASDGGLEVEGGVEVDQQVEDGAGDGRSVGTLDPLLGVEDDEQYYDQRNWRRISLFELGKFYPSSLLFSHLLCALDSAVLAPVGSYPGSCSTQ